ncbi:ABC transporter permease [Anaerosporobacter faecicola]|uniref:ABC transporter permease n=1 Tax=Anaerosporobacter faecicola TaxID=2718714 RepID=UPI001438EFBF|nr:ABC-2 family transporter protein [Anaerosporobacter faecicola]
MEQKKQSLRQKFRIYKPFTVCRIQEQLAYKWSFYLFIFSSLFCVFVVYYLWKAIYNSSSSATINGFTLNEMIVYIFMSFITSNLVRVGVTRDIGNEVVEGTIAMNLIKPIHYQTRLFFSSLGNLLFRFLVPGIPVWLILTICQYQTAGQLPPSPFTILLYLLSAILSFGIMFLFDFCFGLLAFYTTYIWGLNLAKQAVLSFLTGQLIPLAFFPTSVQKIFEFLPFASMNYTPVMIYLNKMPGERVFFSMGVQLVWLVILYLVAHGLWKRVTKRITILGG